MGYVIPMPSRVRWETAELAARMHRAGESRLKMSAAQVSQQRLHARDRRWRYLLECGRLEEFEQEFPGFVARCGGDT